MSGKIQFSRYLGNSFNVRAAACLVSPPDKAALVPNCSTQIFIKRKMNTIKLWPIILIKFSKKLIFVFFPEHVYKTVCEKNEKSKGKQRGTAGPGLGIIGYKRNQLYLIPAPQPPVGLLWALLSPEKRGDRGPG